MLICPSCHASVDNSADDWMLCPECGFAFEDDEEQPTARDHEAIRDPEPEQDLVYPSEMSEEDLEPDHVEIAVRPRPESVASPPKPAAPPPPPPPPAPREATLDPRAKKLLDAAEKDRARGDLTSALNNLKLAVTFDPGSAELRKRLSEVSRLQPAPTPRAPSRAVSQKQAAGDKNLDETIGALKKSLANPKKKEPPPETKRPGSGVLGMFGKKK